MRFLKRVVRKCFGGMVFREVLVIFLVRFLKKGSEGGCWGGF